MRFRRALTLFILATALPFSPAAWARQRNVAPTLRSAPTGHLPGTHSVAASLPRHGGVPIGSGQVPPPLRHADLKVGGTVAAVSDRRPAVGTPPLQKLT